MTIKQRGGSRVHRKACLSVSYEISPITIHLSMLYSHMVDLQALDLSLSNVMRMHALTFWAFDSKLPVLLRDRKSVV